MAADRTESPKIRQARALKCNAIGKSLFLSCIFEVVSPHSGFVDSTSPFLEYLIFAEHRDWQPVEDNQEKRSEAEEGELQVAFECLQICQ